MKKSMIALLSGLAVAALLAGPANADESTDAPANAEEEGDGEIGPLVSANLFRDADFVGLLQGFSGTGCKNVSASANDQASSVSTSSGRIDLFQNANCAGFLGTVTTSHPNLHQFGAGDKVSSIRLYND